jgi:hypothetical protein
LWGYHQVVGLGFNSHGFALADAFLVGLAEDALAAAAGLGAGFLGLADFLVAVIFGGSGASVTG